MRTRFVVYLLFVAPFLFVSWGSVRAQESSAVIRPGTIYAMVSHDDAVDVVDSEGNPREVVFHPESGSEVGVIPIHEGETLRTKEGEDCDVYVPLTGTLRLTSETAVRVPAGQAEGEPKKDPCSLELLKGKLFLRVDGAHKDAASKTEFRLRTPSSILAVKGTRFFVEAGESFDTVGVHEGNVVLKEPISGALADLKAGQAASVKPEQVSPVRRLTREEVEYDPYYTSNTIEEVASEGARREYTSKFSIYDPVTQEMVEDPKRIKVEEAEDDSIPGKVLRVTMKPHLDTATAGYGDLTIELEPELPGEPVAVFFLVRSTGMREPGYTVGIGWNEARHGILETNYRQVPGRLDGSEWVPVVVSAKAIDSPMSEGGFLSVTLNMSYLPGDPQYTYLTEGLDEYIFEISPVFVLAKAETR